MEYSSEPGWFRDVFHRRLFAVCSLRNFTEHDVTGDWVSEESRGDPRGTGDPEIRGLGCLLISYMFCAAMSAARENENRRKNPRTQLYQGNSNEQSETASEPTLQVTSATSKGSRPRNPRGFRGRMAQPPSSHQRLR